MPPHPHDYPARPHSHPDPYTPRPDGWPPSEVSERLTADQRRHRSVLEAALREVTGDGRRQPIKAK